MALKQWLLSGLLASTCLVSIAAAGPIENYSPVTADRLKNPEPGNWMHYRRTYDGQGYSTLDQINTSQREKPGAGVDFLDRCGRRTPGSADHQQWRDVRLNTGRAGGMRQRQDGDEYWRYKTPASRRPLSIAPDQPRRRTMAGQAVPRHDRRPSGRARCQDGKVVWDPKVQDYKKGMYLTCAAVVDGKVIVGGFRRRVSAIRVISLPTMPTRARSCGEPSPFPARASPAMRRGAATTGKRGARLPDDRTYDMDTRTSTGALATPRLAGETHTGDNLYSTSVSRSIPTAQDEIILPVPIKTIPGTEEVDAPC